MGYLDRLNENQLKSVKETEGYVRVIAGPGSGKTATISARFAYLVKELGIPASNILCLTFTNKAAKEMKDRIECLVGKLGKGAMICTYHSFCLRFLREEIYRINLAKNFSVMDESDSLEIMKEIFQEQGLNGTDMKHSDALSKIHYTKSSNIHYIDYFDDKKQKKSTDFDSVFSAFITKQRKYNMLDFDDLINFTLSILANNDDIRSKWDAMISYIMVDEVQDSSKRQWELIDLLRKDNNNLYIVGDPDQAIYAWRGASPILFLNFDHHHIPCKDIVLDINYRSLPCILESSNNLISMNTSRFNKQMKPVKNKVKDVIWHHAGSEFDEANWIASKINNLKDSGIPYKDIAILYRSSYSSRVIEQALIRSEIPYIVYGGVRFFEKSEIKDVIAYMKMVISDDDYSFKRTINTPKRGLGNVFLRKLKEIAEKNGCSMFEALYNNLYSSSFNKEGAIFYCKFIKECRKMKSMFSISDLIEYIIDESGIRRTLKDNGDEERMENLKEFVSMSLKYEKDNEEVENIELLNNFMQDISLYTNLDMKNKTDSVRLMTIHQSKGLEFNTVFIYNLTEGALPNYKVVKDKGEKGIAEERNLMYVAMTRAEENLFFTDSCGYNGVSNTNKTPSPFIIESKPFAMSKESVEIEEKKEIAEIEANSDFIFNFKKGDYILHPYFGAGTILQIVDTGYLIDFSGKQRYISASFGGMIKNPIGSN